MSSVNGTYENFTVTMQCSNLHSLYVDAIATTCDSLLYVRLLSMESSSFLATYASALYSPYSVRLDIFMVAVAQGCLCLFLIILVGYAELGWKTFDDE